MHDIAPLLGSHGRWGCHALAPGGGEYWIRDTTLPFVLYMPALVAVIAAGRRAARRRKVAHGEPVQLTGSADG